MRPRVQAFPFIFFHLAIFFLCLMNWVWTPLSPHIERYSHSSADGLSKCFRKKTKNQPFVPSIHSIYLSKKLDSYFSRLNWRNNLPQVELDKTEKKNLLLSASLIPHPPTTLFPSFRLLSSVRLLLPVETWSCLSSQFYVSYVPE